MLRAAGRPHTKGIGWVVTRAVVWGTAVAVVAGVATLAAPPAMAQTIPAAPTALVATTQTVSVHARPNQPDLVCEPPRARPPRSSGGGGSVPQDPLVIPDAEVVDLEKEQMKELAADSPDPVSGKAPAAVPGGIKRPLFRAAAADQPFRLAIWGDSHMAAAFFSAELVRQAGLKPEQVQSAFIPANMNRAGVRLPVRKTCVSAGWRYESAHAIADAAQAPGPALVNLVSTEANASLAWDLRSPGGQPRQASVRLLYQQTAAPRRIVLSVDGGEEQEVILSGQPGPGVLELVGDGALSVVKVRVPEGSLRVHGLAPEPGNTNTARLQLDLFGYPGATVAGWRQANLAYFKAWFPDPAYQLVALAYGTNEGNNKPFDAASYRQTLVKAVAQMKAVFPDSACLLIGPGDRGILIRKSSVGKIKKKKPGPHPNLFVYSRIHAQIGTIQKDVAAQYGCQAWTMLEAMGGPASAYTWARQRPPLMAGDLIHFTVPGYERLAQKLAQDMDWRPEALWPGR